METCNLSKVSEDDDCNNIQKVEEQIESKMLSADKEKLVQELIDMGFSKSAVVQIVENARDVPKNMIIEQLLSSNYRPENLPVLDDDDDPMWEDITVTNKMVIVINKGLNMGIGKIASQAAHAALGLYEMMKENIDLTNNLISWNEQGSRKIVVEAKDTVELMKLCSMGRIHNIPFFCVHDAGRTEVAPDSFTALAFFGSDEELKHVTGKLRLLK
ncbi:Peptidyl-tRNA hydrolase, PTH2,Ubiquitin-associated domain,Peptidyl-tRNA hydrolase II domain [Cinara cedri]|uniref:peptidyl-tRNA hydrolase n=1 Tax=Cinara cedri TaxID=506608 RepID=A0A5E4NNH2_9HEMI|nr:Peptidyl-tRNA hydrolase, PTH2,Ubiquitin-associated domain,Peptidyl-tRNA hydrolase II domain [Cinara cedri]